MRMYRPCGTAEGQAPGLLEATRRPNMKGVAKKRKTAPDLLIDTTNDDIPEIPAGKVGRAVEPTVEVVPPPIARSEEVILDDEITKLLEKMGRAEAVARQ